MKFFQETKGKWKKKGTVEKNSRGKKVIMKIRIYVRNIFSEWIAFDKKKGEEWMSGVGRFDPRSSGHRWRIRWSIFWIYCCGVFSRDLDLGSLVPVTQKVIIPTLLRRIPIYHLCVGVACVMHRLSKQVVIISPLKGLSPPFNLLLFSR